MSTAENQEIRKEDTRFVIEIDSQEAGFAEFSDNDGVRNFDHTVVDPAFRGQGLSKPLISFALDETRKEGLKVKPTCSAFAGFIEKNEGYQDLLA